MKIVRNNFLPMREYKVLNLFGVLFVRYDTILNEVDVNHEQIHTEQYKELLYVGYLPLYGLMYLWELIRYRDCHKTYRAVPFEKEAYAHEKEKDYLKVRKHYAWINDNSINN